MAKNFASNYTTANDSVGLNQTVFVKEEVARGTLIAPVGADKIEILTGGSIVFSRPVESSPVRSGRHHTNVIEQKDSTTWSFPMFHMIDEDLGSFGVAEIDPAQRVLMKSLMGNETVGGSDLVYESSIAPDTTFSLFENGDQWANQAPGAFVLGNTMDFPGDGQAQQNWTGAAKTMHKIGIGLTTADNNTTNIVVLQTGEGERMEVGGFVMLVEADGVTRSADTPDGSPRTILSISGDSITIDGAVLADADGSGGDIYLSFYEPETPVAINNPLTGLVGTIVIAGLSQDCVRSLSLDVQNNHEIQDFCWGERGLSGPLFTPGARLSVDVSMDLNLNHNLVEFIKGLKQFTGEDITLTLGAVAGRRLTILVPKAIFSIPEIAIPDEGTIPVSFSGLAYQTADDAADELTFKYE